MAFNERETLIKEYQTVIDQHVREIELTRIELTNLQEEKKIGEKQFNDTIGILKDENNTLQMELQTQRLSTSLVLIFLIPFQCIS